jgi:hypothetical protein
MENRKYLKRILKIISKKVAKYEKSVVLLLIITWVLLIINIALEMIYLSAL